MLDAYLIDNYLDMQLFYKAFELMKKRVFSNDYTSYQMVQYGKKYLGLDEDQALDIIHEFMERHWLTIRSMPLIRRRLGIVWSA